ncbi:MAG: hypothetical protein IAF08_00665 [Rhizobacter sp.]|nr:hypothetical protein [Chlorobiales bacterium]
MTLPSSPVNPLSVRVYGGLFFLTLCFSEFGELKRTLYLGKTIKFAEARHRLLQLWRGGSEKLQRGSHIFTLQLI